MTHPRAGLPAEADDLIDIAEVVTAYYTREPDLTDPAQQVSFGTSGHRGSSLDGAFNEAHIAATTQAICEYRAGAGITGPLFCGRDTHALSEPAWTTAVEVLVANDVEVRVDSDGRYTPTPAISHAILGHNRRLGAGAVGRADGIVVTPSHNPPRDGGFKYNPPHGGPADTDATDAIAARANELLAAGNAGVRRVTITAALAGDLVVRHDYRSAYVDDLASMVDLEAIAAAGVRIGADPLGGASVDYWGAIAERYGLDLTVVNPLVDATWRFMTLDGDGKIRMDCSSPNAMASLIANRDRYDVSTGNDADADRHGIVTPDGGLMNPNHFLAVAIEHLFTHRSGWPDATAIGKTLVSSAMIDRVAASLGRDLLEVPVGFKWFVPGSARTDRSASVARNRPGRRSCAPTAPPGPPTRTAWCCACSPPRSSRSTGSSPSEHYQRLAERHGAPAYARIDAPATREQKAVLKSLSADQVRADTLAGDPIVSVTTTAPGNGAAIGGLKVSSTDAWFAARPSGTEDVYKIYAESFTGADHLAEVQAAARELVGTVLGS